MSALSASRIGSTTQVNCKAYSIGKEPRGKSLISSEFIIIFHSVAKFVNPKIVTDVPGPGAHQPKDSYSTKNTTNSVWSINKTDKNKRPKSVK